MWCRSAVQTVSCPLKLVWCVLGWFWVVQRVSTDRSDIAFSFGFDGFMKLENSFLKPKPISENKYAIIWIKMNIYHDHETKSMAYHFLCVARKVLFMSLNKFRLYSLRFAESMTSRKRHTTFQDEWVLVQSLSKYKGNTCMSHTITIQKFGLLRISRTNSNCCILPVCAELSLCSY